MEQLHKKLEFVEYLFRCSHNSTIFPRTECVELKKRRAKLKNVEQSSPKHPLSQSVTAIKTAANKLGITLMVEFDIKMSLRNTGHIVKKFGTRPISFLARISIIYIVVSY